MKAGVSLILSHSPEFQAQAMHEVARRVEFRANPLARGLTRIDLSGPYRPLREHWAMRPPIYLHHLFRLDYQMSAARPDPGKVAGRLHRFANFALQFRSLAGPRPDMAIYLERSLARLRPVAQHAPEAIVSALLVGDQLLVGVDPPAYNLSPWSGGCPYFPPDPGRFSKAEPKLLEALEVFGLHPRGRALDLGSSLGGWSRVLLGLGLQVTAVDPQPPHPSLELDHRPMTAQQFLADNQDRFDFVTNDMILAPQESARLMVACAAHLASGTSAVMTLKVGTRGRLAAADHALRILRRVYRIPRLKQLYHNGAEVTAWLVRR